MTTEINVNYVPTYLLNDDGTVKEGSEAEAARISAGVATAISNLPVEEQAMFLALLKTELIVPNTQDDYSEENIEKSLAALALAAEVIIDLFETAGGDFSVLAILLESYFLEQVEALETRERSRQSARDLLMHQADKMMDSAKETVNAALVNCVTSCVSCAVTVLSAALSMVFASQQASASKDAATHETQVNEANTKLSNPNIAPNERPQIHEDIKTSTSTMRQHQQVAAMAGHRSDSLRILSRQTTETGSAVGGYLQSEKQSEGKVDEAKGSEAAALASQESGTSDIAKTIQSAYESAIAELISAFKAMLANETELLKGARGV